MSKYRKSGAPRRRPGWLAWFAMTAMVAALVPAFLTAGTGTASAAVSRPAAPAASRTIRFRVLNATDVELHYRSDHVYDSGRWRAGEHPADTEPIAVDDYNAESTVGKVGAEVYYQIGDSIYYLHVYADDPLIGPNDTTCAVTLANGGIDTSVYTCSNHTGSGNDMNADFVVQPKAAAKTTLTPSSGLSDGGLTQQLAVETLCGTSGAYYASCDVASSADVKNVTVTPGPERIVSPVLINCTTSTSDVTLTSTDTATETTTIGVNGDITYKLSEKITPKLAASYQHQWTHTVTSSQATKVTAKPDEYVYMTEALWMQQITATWTLTAGNQTFLVTDLTLLRPSKDVYTNAATAYAHAVPAGYCSSHSKTAPFLLTRPDTPVAGLLYTIRPQMASGRSIAVPGASHLASVALQLAAVSNSARSQQWIFYEVPGYPDYYQVRSLNTPNMCLDLNGIDHTTVMQFTCKAANDPTIGNQLWTLAYDASNNSLAMVSMEVDTSNLYIPSRTLALNSAGFDIGDPVVGLASPAANVSSWAFYQL